MLKNQIKRLKIRQFFGRRRLTKRLVAVLLNKHKQFTDNENLIKANSIWLVTKVSNIAMNELRSNGIAVVLYYLLTTYVLVLCY